MNNTSPKRYDVDDPVVLQPTKASLRGDIEGLGKFLFQMHSTHYVPPIFAKEETSLQFYEHVVVVNITTKLWCFPKSSTTIVIPRFKIIDASFTFKPRTFPTFVCFLMLIAFILIGVGLFNGGCQYPSLFCSLLWIGVCVLLIPVPLLLVIPFCFKKHHVYLDVKKPPKTGFFNSHSKGCSTTYDFRFKRIGFEHFTYNKAAFDEIYIMNYVFGSLGYHGKKAMNKYHLLSHFHHVDFANPIAPLHADDSFRDILVTTGAEGLAPSAVIHSMYPRAADGPLMRQNMNAHHHKRRQITVPV